MHMIKIFNPAVRYKSNPKSFHHKEKNLFSISLILYLYEMIVSTKLIMVIIPWCVQVKPLCCTPQTYVCAAQVNYISIKLEKN